MKLTSWKIDWIIKLKKKGEISAAFEVEFVKESIHNC